LTQPITGSSLLPNVRGGTILASPRFDPANHRQFAATQPSDRLIEQVVAVSDKPRLQVVEQHTLGHHLLCRLPACPAVVVVVEVE